MSPDAIIDSEKVAIYNGPIATQVEAPRGAPTVLVVAQQGQPTSGSGCCTWPAPLAACSAATALVVIVAVVAAAAIFTCTSDYHHPGQRSLRVLTSPRRTLLTIYNITDNGTQFPWMANCELPPNSNLSLALWSENTYLKNVDRVVYLVLFGLVGGAAIALNVAELYVVFTRKYRLMLRCCLGSLAASDLLLSVFAVISNTSNLSHPILRWNLGAAMCGSVPLMEFAGALANALTLGLVALDRYRSLLLAAGPGRWEPAAPACSTCLAIIWVVAFGVASPSVSLYEVTLTLVLVMEGGRPADCRLLDRCYESTEASGKTYMRVLFGFIFIPLLLAFLVLHAVVASFVWRKRKPFASAPACGAQNARCGKDRGDGTTSNSSGDANRSNNATSSSDTLSGRARTAAGAASTATATATATGVASPSGPFQRAPTAKKTSPHTVRNIRSFRRIIVMMVLFFVCRLPNWLFNIVHDAAGTGDKYAWWLARYGVNLLALFNSVVNPLLYCFFNETLSAVARVRSWLTRPCRAGADPQCQQQPSRPREPPRPPSIVPRGPYYDAEHRTANWKP
ncbi:gastrin/cholecystokinin type B receptor-like [Schistocerca nitens]|uniref:gastrin/cholecystokinin type B receptor-like n=1 Tax=Schistocerca nitens TaxID=7011 RepID=UPI0021178717|nr:gastrin/cholecystokinin type B receptor-like [Schistocerca nitens]